MNHAVPRVDYKPSALCGDRALGGPPTASLRHRRYSEARRPYRRL